MTFDAGVALLREFGFPVFVSLWFMWRLEKRIDRQSELMGALMQGVALLSKSIDSNIVKGPRPRQTDPMPLLPDSEEI